MTLFTKKPKGPRPPSHEEFLRSLTIDILRQQTEATAILREMAANLRQMPEATALLRQISSLLQGEAALRTEYMQMKVSIARQVLTPIPEAKKNKNDDRY